LGEVGVSYAAVTLVAAGGVKQYKWSISSGALPGGVTLSSKGIATGKPTAPGTFSFVVRVDDAAGGAAGGPTSIFVFRQIAFTTASTTCTGSVQSGCTVSLNYSGGASSATPKLKFTLSSANAPLPPGSTFIAKAGVVTVSIAGPQCQYLNGFDAIAIALLARSNPWGILPAALLFGALHSGSSFMQLQTDVSADVISVVQASVIIFVAAPAIVRWIFRLRPEAAGSVQITSREAETRV